MSMQRVCDYLKQAGTYYLATVEGDQPRVRPFGTVNIFDGKLYIQTGKVKPCSKQMVANPKIEISAMGPDGTWIRLAANAITDDRREAKQSMLDAYPQLAAMYSVDDDNTHVLYLQDAEAKISSFAGGEEVIKF